MVIDDMSQFTPGETENALATIVKAEGTSPLERAIDGAAEDLAGLDGKHAVIIVTDGKGMDTAPAVSATALKKTFGDNLCIYPILVGDAPEGKMLMDSLAGIGGCGFAANAEDLASGQQMADYVGKIFVGDLLDSDGDGVADDRDNCPGTPAGVAVGEDGCPLDSDGDGVTDDMDQCPGTPVGVEVDEVGCPKTVLGGGARSWTFNNITFDLNKAVIQASSYEVLDEIAAALKADPQLRVTIEGHADSTGEQAYNQDLSQRRAEAVVEYLAGQGVDASRLSAKGYGEDRPIADNATPEGRAKNRRVQLTRIKN
jgi:OOP family OmpA-OmpF porin